jgi:hypothetical protein
MADYSQLMNLEKEKKEKGQKPVSSVQSTAQSINQSTNRSTDLSTSQLTSHTTNQSISQPAYASRSKIVDKPKAFYITEQLNKRLDDAVRYFQEKHGIKKVDRSTLVNVLLDNDANWSEEALDLVLDRVISQLTSRLTNR